MAGAADEDGLPVMKPTEWTANSATLVKPMKRLKCDHLHAHAHPTGKHLEKLKEYTWKLCNAVVTGIIMLKKELTSDAFWAPTKI